VTSSEPGESLLLPEFAPAAWLPGKHLETIVPAFWPARSPGTLKITRIVLVDTGSAVRVHVAWPAGPCRGTLLLVHGMGGSSESGYMRRTAAMAVSLGWIAARMNCRNCGGTEALSRTLFNAGQSDDVGRVILDLEAAGFSRPIAAVGFSLGGSLVLRYAGRAAAACGADAVAAVNPPVDLEACCRSLERRENSAYHAYFTWRLCRILQRIRSVRPLAGPLPRIRTVRTLRRLDSLYTAPDAGYATAEEYYVGASAGPHLARIRVPALVIASENDPIVPLESLARFRPLRSRHVRFVHPARGGHIGYWQTGTPRYWAGEAVLRYLDLALPRA